MNDEVIDFANELAKNLNEEIEIRKDAWALGNYQNDQGLADFNRGMIRAYFEVIQEMQRMINKKRSDFMEDEGE